MNTPLPEGEFPTGAAEGADRFLADVRGDEAIAARRRERWALAREQEATTIVSALDVATDSTVTLHLRSGDRAHGVVATVGSDYVELASTSTTRWIPFTAVAGVESDRRLIADPGDLDTPLTNLAGALQDMVEERSVIVVTLSSTTVLRGETIASGAALTIQTVGSSTHTIISWDAIESISLVARL